MKLKPKVFIFIGRSGCGKGTQAELLTEKLNKIDSSINTLHIQTGAEFRNFIQGQSLTQKLSNEIYESGGLQPEFLAIHMWINVLVRDYRGGQHIMFDGTPRKYHEAGTLDSILDFYDLDKPFVIHINISKEEAKKRLLLRKRMDDTEEEIDKRLDWFETDVKKALQFYEGNKRYNFIEVDGEKTPQEIHEDILEKMGFAV